MSVDTLDIKIVEKDLPADAVIAPLNSIAIPKWLNDKFLQKYLKKYFHDNEPTVISFEAKSATAKGENYASCIYRVCVVFSDTPKTVQTISNHVRERMLHIF